MSQSYKVLYQFTAPQGHLAEIKRLDLPADASKEQVYHWLWFAHGKVQTLRFVSMQKSSCQQRSFEEARLWFDAAKGELTWRHGTVTPLVVLDAAALPAALHTLVTAHFGA